MKRPSRLALRMACYGLALLALGCSQQPPAPADTRAADTRAADEATIREAEIAWSNAAAAKDVNATVAYYADDGSAFPPNGPILTGKEAITKMWEGIFQAPGSSVSWQPVKVEVARSGDLGYTHGTYQMTMNDPAGNPVADRGKYVTVWKKQTDGSWKVMADIFNSDLPLPPPAK